SVGMGFHRPHQLESVFAQRGQVAIKLLGHRVDDDGVARILVKHHIGARTGDVIKKLNGLHDVSLASQEYFDSISATSSAGTLPSAITQPTRAKKDLSRALRTAASCWATFSQSASVSMSF